MLEKKGDKGRCVAAVKAVLGRSRARKGRVPRAEAVLLLGLKDERHYPVEAALALWLERADSCIIGRK